MRTYVQFFALIMAASQFAPALAQDAPRDPRIGNWDAAKSHQRRNACDLRRPGRGSLHTQYFPQRPPATRTEVEARCDGGTYSLVYGDGRPVGDSLSCRVTGPRTFSYLYTMGKPVTWVTSSGLRLFPKTARR